MSISSRTFIIIICFMLMGGGVFYHLSTINRIENKYKEAFVCAHDSIEELVLENKNIVYVVNSLHVEMGIYKDSLSILQKALSESNKGEIERIAEISTVTQFDTIYIPLSPEQPSKPTIWFKNESDLFSMSGAIESDSLIIDKLSIPANLNIGYTDTGFLFATSDNPHVQIKNISSNIRPPTKTNVYHSLSIGVGINYGLIHNELDFGPCISYGFVVEF